MKLSEAFAQKTYGRVDVKPLIQARKKIQYEHEDDISVLLSNWIPPEANGLIPAYVFYNDNHETIYISTSPITLDRLREEVPENFGEDDMPDEY